MKIVIVGCGKVGSTLAEQLAEENDITVIDENEEVAEELTNNIDAIAIGGNCVTLEVLKSADVGSADLLIAVTQRDEVNLLCCLFAKKLGVKSTIARVRNPEYVEGVNFIRGELGLSRVINPEKETANEIAKLIKFPSAIEVDSFAGGKAEIVEVKLTEGNPLCNMAIKDIIQKSKIKFLICIVQRGNDAVIPDGNFVLEAGDIISVVANDDNQFKFLKYADLLADRINSCMIYGGGRIAYYLAQNLSKDKISVNILEKDEERCEELSEMLDGRVRITNLPEEYNQTLLDEGIDTVGAFVSLSGTDEENVLMSLFAGIKSKAKLITRVNKQNLKDVMVGLKLGNLISPRLVTAERILTFVRAMQNSEGKDEVVALSKLAEDKVEALEFRVNDSINQAFLGKPLHELKIRKNVLVGCISRKDKVIIPSGSDTIEKGDSVIIVTTEKGISDLNKIIEI